MEEIVILIIQFVAEVLLDWLIFVPFDFGLRGDSGRGGRNGCGWLVFFLVLGGLLGRVSLAIAPHLLLHSPGLRIANLIVGPLVAAGMSWLLNSWRRSRGAAVDPRSHALVALVFVLAFAGVRLAYAA